MGVTRHGGLLRRREDSGFSLLEILITLALIALLTGMFATGSARLLDSRALSAEDVFWKAITEARKYALLHNQDVRLSYDSKGKAFEAATIEGVRRFPVPIPGELALDFLRTNTAGRSTIMIGGTLVETQPMPFVTFYSDGTCSAFRAQIRTGGQPRYLNIDPWTCAPVLDAKESVR